MFSPKIKMSKAFSVKRDFTGAIRIKKEIGDHVSHIRIHPNLFKENAAGLFIKEYFIRNNKNFFCTIKG